ncbi:MAG TPA: sulfurtransferase-like selenium metabolism protein YedF [Candidatus Pelethocola excrementipullorum]|nr:sulfurtransferase-like selenium metabolism protein YedF [Candidatus Pelethocola excrementipullorum]
MTLDARGKVCPLPVIEAKKALEAAPAGEIVAVTVDNEIAVQNLQKMAAHKGLTSEARQEGDQEFTVEIKVSGSESQNKGQEGQTIAKSNQEDSVSLVEGRRTGMVVVLASRCMGSGEEKLGKTLMKGFVYALTQQDVLPETVLLYNSGAYLSCKDSDSLEDLLLLESRGVEILTCGTCLNYYELSEKLGVGTATNMYEIVEKQTGASLIIRP